MNLLRVPLQSAPHIVMQGTSNHRPQRGWDRYKLPGLWCLHFYCYSGTLRVEGESFVIAPGCVSLTPPDALLEFAYSQAPAVHAFAHFSLPHAERDQCVSLPPMHDLGEHFGAMMQLFAEAAAWRITQPARARARLWDVLWRLAELTNGAQAMNDAPLHPAVAEALRFIEAAPVATLRVSHLAQHVGFSHNHFTRLFQSATGFSPAAYIRHRRVERASHLLRHSTLPIKAIAAQCGLGDLQSFNKAMRRETGDSPRALRARLTEKSS